MLYVIPFAIWKDVDDFFLHSHWICFVVFHGKLLAAFSLYHVQESVFNITQYLRWIIAYFKGNSVSHIACLLARLLMLYRNCCQQSFLIKWKSTRAYIALVSHLFVYLLITVIMQICMTTNTRIRLYFVLRWCKVLWKWVVWRKKRWKNSELRNLKIGVRCTTINCTQQSKH